LALNRQVSLSTFHAAMGDTTLDNEAEALAHAAELEEQEASRKRKQAG
jgi:hypothetical protein